MSDDPDLDDLSRRMEGALGVLKTELAGLRTGRASGTMLDSVRVDAYGAKMPISQVASINVPEPRMLTVTVWDQGLVTEVEKAIRNSGIGINPVTEGALIRLPIPDLSEERRREMAKVAGKLAEQARVAVRNIRRSGIEDLRKPKSAGMSEDDHKLWQTEIQQMTDAAIAQIDQAMAQKEESIFRI